MEKLIDFTAITACGECCTGCRKRIAGLCKGCIEADGYVPEWSDSGRCPVHACTREHGVQFCGLCKEFPCKGLTAKIHWNPNIVEHFQQLIKQYQDFNALILLRPTDLYADQVMSYRKEMLENGDSLDGCAGLEDVDSFSEWVDFERRLKAKYQDGYVPSEVYLAIRRHDNRVVGIIDYRHPLSEFLLNFGGNIGYSIRPSERRKGYATEMLRLLLPICREYGESKVLLTCDKGNEASRRTILHNQGVMENEVPDSAGLGNSGVIQRYWIAL